MSAGNSKCSRCPSPVVNTVRILGILLAFLLVLLVVILFNIRKTKESEASILGKIFTNYVHCITATLTFNFDYPNFLQTSLRPASEVGRTSESIFSFDCFIKDLRLDTFGDSHFIAKSLFSCLLPFLVILLYFSLFSLVKCFKNDTRWKRNICITFISIVYFLHPSLTEKTFGLFRCTTYYERTLLLADLELECWTGTHLSWSIFLGIPMAVVCVVVPISGILLLLRNRKHLTSPGFK